MGSRWWIVLSLVISLLTACEKRPEGVMSESKLVDVMTDMELADAYFNTSKGGSGKLSKDMLHASVLKKHGITQEEMDSTVAYYGKNIDDFYKLYAKVDRNLKKQSLTGEIEKQEEENNIWPYGDFAMLMANQTSDGIVFSIPLEGVTPGEALEWRMRFSSSDGVEAMLGVEYENGGSTLMKKSATGNKSIKIPIQTDTAAHVKRVFGVMTAPSTATPVYVDSIRLVKMPFDSVSYQRNINLQKNIRPTEPKPKPSVEKQDSI